jgi:hypothetical protein
MVASYSTNGDFPFWGDFPFRFFECFSADFVFLPSNWQTGFTLIGRRPAIPGWNRGPKRK